MSNTCPTLTIFVASVCDSYTDGKESQHAYGVFYDSTKLSSFNSSLKISGLLGGPPSMSPLCAGIIAAVTDGPRYHNLTIEIDNKGMVDVINHAAYRSKKIKDNSYQTPEMQGILEAVEMRTERGDTFVDFVYSGNDPLAQKGLSLARALAEKALAQP